jgi:hypothetical protein
MNKGEAQKIVTGIRQQLGILAEKGDLSTAVRQAHVAKILGELTKLEALLK